MGGKLNLEVPGEIILFLLFKAFLMLQNISFIMYYNPPGWFPPFRGSPSIGGFAINGTYDLMRFPHLSQVISIMQITLASISPRRGRSKSEPAAQLVDDFAARAGRLNPTEVLVYPTEAALLESLDRDSSRQRATLILFDSRGDLLTSEQFAQLLGRLRDDGAQRIVFAIGPADGWSEAAGARAHKNLSFGRMTLPHELARAVLAEQVYRALTILAGHPYHFGH